MMELGRIYSQEDVASGAISGILICGGLLSWMFTDYTWIGNLAFIISGLICLADASFPFGRQPHMGSISGGFIIGFALLLICAAFRLAYILCVVALAAFLLSLISRRAGGKSSGKKGF
jgi:hypothetical protein